MSATRLFSPLTVTIGAGALLAVATLGGVAQHQSAQAAKTDRFAVVGDAFCHGQEWPNMSSECLAWTHGEWDLSPARVISVTDADNATTTLHREPLPAL